jgi:protein-S-isoprenylcysteine O-methyltransferase Ste14
VVLQNAGFFFVGLGLCFSLKACWFGLVFALFWLLLSVGSVTTQEKALVTSTLSPQNDYSI